MSRLKTLLPALLLAGGAAAAPPGAFGPAPGERLAPGTRVVVTWGGERAGTEAELVLSLDGGRSFPLRLTAETAPAEGALAFRVPNLATREAVVALRTGDEGCEETIRATSAPFVIEADPRGAPEPLFAREGELATREAAEGGVPLLPAGLGAPERRVGALDDGLEPLDAAALLPALPPLAPSGRLAEAAFAPPEPRTGLFATVSLPKRE